MTHPTVKNKLYDFLDKRRNLIAVLIFLLFFLAPFIVATDNEVLIKVLVIGLVVPLYLACGFLILEDMEKRHQKARQLLKDQDTFVAVVTDLAVRTHQSKAEVLRNAVNLYYNAFEQELKKQQTMGTKEQNKI
jgi:hypothetical protein